MVFGFGSSSSSPLAPSASSTSTSDPFLPAPSTPTPPLAPSSFSPSDPATTKPAPNRDQRSACWTSRDTYFSCLDKNRLIQAGDEMKGEGKGVCSAERGEYEVHCGKSWIDYFNKRRTLEFRQRLTLDAAAKQGVKVPGR